MLDGVGIESWCLSMRRVPERRRFGLDNLLFPRLQSELTPAGGVSLQSGNPWSIKSTVYTTLTSTTPDACTCHACHVHHKRRKPTLPHPISCASSTCNEDSTPINASNSAQPASFPLHLLPTYLQYPLAMDPAVNPSPPNPSPIPPSPLNSTSSISCPPISGP